MFLDLNQKEASYEGDETLQCQFAIKSKKLNTKMSYAVQILMNMTATIISFCPPT